MLAVKTYNYFKDQLKHDVSTKVLKKQYYWSETEGLQAKKYKDYNEYVAHQRSKYLTIKGENGWLSKNDKRFIKALEGRLTKHLKKLSKGNFLCLAARTGTEVRYFISKGFFAVGIDVEPGERNEYVVVGDFNKLQYANESVDYVYCNSLDHSNDLAFTIGEARRVLKDGGLFFLELSKGEAEGGTVGYYEATKWSKVDDVLAVFKNLGFSVTHREDFNEPWKGELVILQKGVTRR